LDSRYQSAKTKATAEGSAGRLSDFEIAVGNSRLVLNMNDNLLWNFLNDANLIYLNYFLMVDRGLILPKPIDQDVERMTVDTLLFGSYFQHIRYAALSLDGSGLESYGNISVTLVDTHLTEAVSFLEENAYRFKEGRVGVSSSTIPEGYLATWETRCKLAVAKLQENIKTSTEPSEFVKLMLQSTKDKRTDKYIEAHTYGDGITRHIFKSVKYVSKQGAKIPSFRLGKIMELLRDFNIAWEEG
jgi:hypothetical protein